MFFRDAEATIESGTRHGMKIRGFAAGIESGARSGL
jgi:hypothetical protein